MILNSSDLVAQDMTSPLNMKVCLKYIPGNLEQNIRPWFSLMEHNTQKQDEMLFNRSLYSRFINLRFSNIVMQTLALPSFHVAAYVKKKIFYYIIWFQNARISVEFAFHGWF